VPTEPGPAREALLDRCLDFLRHNGFSQLSLREIAAGVGTSHRMLLYHFGSREGLLAAVVGRVEAEQRAALQDMAAVAGDLVEVSRAFWRRVSDPALAPAERLFFEVYAQALYGREWTAAFRESVIAAWQAPMVELLVARGFTAEQAAHRVRLGIAATRGLLLDLLITGDRSTVDGAAEVLAHVMAAGPPR
jgi:AcrR family transcriptional regulator